MLNLIFIIYSLGILALVLNRYHIILLLISIEFIYLSLIIMLFYNSFFLNIINIFLFLVRIVCEAALGLRLLVSISFFMEMI